MATITPPSSQIQSALLDTTRHIRRKVEIYELDGVTPYYLNPGFAGFSISVDGTRAERRSLTLQIRNEGGLTQEVGELWYDKIIKCYRGFDLVDDTYLPCVGTFIMDRHRKPRQTNLIELTGRDLSKRLSFNFGEWVEFPVNTPIENVIADIAIAGGLEPGLIDLPLSGLNTGNELTYEPSSVRWTAMRELADSHNYDLFFTADGKLIMEEYPRLVGDPVQHVFETGPRGNIGDYSREGTDAPIYNKVVVVGASNEYNDLPAFGVAVNQAGTPTSVDRIGLRPITVSRTELVYDAECQLLADRLLEDYSKERFDIGATVLTTPWLEANILCQFERQNPDDFDEVRRYVLESFSISSEGGLMDAALSRLQS